MLFFINNVDYLGEILIVAGIFNGTRRIGGKNP
jgi:hypothetical protein